MSVVTQTTVPYVLAMPYAECWKRLLDYEFQKALDSLNLQKPLSQLIVNNTPITAATNIINADSTKGLRAKNSPCIFRIYVVLGTSGVFSVQRTASGAIVTENMNQGVALAANSAYMFDILVDANETIDFQSTATGILLKLSVVEKDDAK